MTRDQVIAKLKENATELHALGARSLYLYSSFARDEATAESDVDVFIDKQPGHRLTFNEYTGMIHLLEDVFGRPVVVGTRKSLHPVLRADIIASAIQCSSGATWRADVWGSM